MGKAVTKRCYMWKYQRRQTIKFIKITNVFSTCIYEVSCVLAVVRSIRLDLEEKLLTYRAAHNIIYYDASLEVRYWTDHVEIPLIRATIYVQHNIIF